MMKIGVKSFLNAGLVLALIAIATGLFLNSQIDYQLHQSREQVRALQQETANVIQNTLLIESGEHLHYDYLTASEKRTEVMLNELAGVTLSGLHVRELNQFSSAVKETLEVASQIKSTFAVFQNSLFFFPKGIALIRNEMAVTAQRQELIPKIDDLERAVMQFTAATANKKNTEELYAQIQLLKADLSLLPEKFSVAITQLLKHTEVLVSYSLQLQSLNTRLLSNNITIYVQTLIDSYHHDEEKKNQKAIVMRNLFYVTLLIMGLFVITLWWKKERRMVAELRKSSEKLKLSARVFSDTKEGICITDAEGTIVDVNPTFCKLTEYSREEAVGKNPRILKSGKHIPAFYSDMWRSIVEKGYWQGEIWNRKKSGKLIAEQLTISSIKDENDKVVNHIGMFSDITVGKCQQEIYEKMAHYDDLTKLPNRTLFADRFSQAVAHCHRSNTFLAICFLDLDGFKPVNDKHGHEIGDLLLIDVAQRIKNIIRQEDTVSRQGGDEFVILLGDISGLPECEFMLERIHQSLAEPYVIDGRNIKIGASSGVTLYPSDESDMDALIHNADQAMYRAKSSGKNRYCLFNAG